jgi:hypothetical protein
LREHVNRNGLVPGLNFPPAPQAAKWSHTFSLDFGLVCLTFTDRIEIPQVFTEIPVGPQNRYERPTTATVALDFVI